MATCPDCGGYLGDGHRCPRTLKRRSQKAMTGVALLGAAAGGALSFLTSSHSVAVMGLSSVLGAFVAVSIYRAVPR